MTNIPESRNDRGGHWDNTQDLVPRVIDDDAVGFLEVQASRLYGWDSVNSVWRRVKVDATGTLAGGSSGGGGAITVADGADVTQGTTTDLSSANTVVGILKAIKAAITGTLTVSGTVTASGPLTDTQLRASAVPVSMVSTTLTGTVDVSDRAARLLGVVDKGKIWDGTNTATVKAGVVSVVGDNPLVVTLHPSSAPTTSQVVTLASTTITGSVAVTGPLTDTQLRASAVPVSLASTTITGTVDVSDRAARLLGIVDKGKIWDGTNIAAVKAASTVPVAADPPLVTALSPNSNPTKIWDGSNAMSVKAASTLVAATDLAAIISQHPSRGDASTLCVTGTAAVNTGVTVTLPIPGAGLFHYITSIQVQKLYSVVGVAAGAGNIITTTNLPGTPAFTTEQLASPAGTVVTVVSLTPTTPLKSSVANTATTIVCPVQLQTIWRVNVTYYTAP